MQCIQNLPATIRVLRGSDKADAKLEVQQLEESVTGLKKIGDWLNEVKDFHKNLHDAKDPNDILNAFIQKRQNAEGQLDLALFPLKEVRQRWTKLHERMSYVAQATQDFDIYTPTLGRLSGASCKRLFSQDETPSVPQVISAYLSEIEQILIEVEDLNARLSLETDTSRYECLQPEYRAHLYLLSNTILDFTRYLNNQLKMANYDLISVSRQISQSLMRLDEL
jgi:hypothetical protein